MHTIRRHLPGLGRFHAALFVLLWATMVATPCVMAVQVEPEPMAAHDCPHCPPQPCHEQASPTDCDETEPADRLRSIDTTQFSIAVPVEAPVAPPDELDARAAPPAAQARSRDGPRPHLLHVRFDE